MPCPTFPEISERSVHNFLSYLAYTQTDRQTKSDKDITSLAEVINGENDKLPKENNYSVVKS